MNDDSAEMATSQLGFFSEVVGVFPSYLPYGFYGLAAIALILSLVMFATVKNPVFCFLYAVLAVLVGYGAFSLHMSQMTPDTKLSEHACIGQGGQQGIVQVTSQIMYEKPPGSGKFVAFGFDKRGQPQPGVWLVSRDDVSDITADTSAAGMMRWAARWECLVLP